MRVLIIEDETAAANNLKLLLAERDIEILDVIESVSESIAWLSSNPAPDLIFLDIHLADGDAFSIFEKIDVQTPIVFTTAYDQYAIKAFKVNSIDYILKPIKPQELTDAIAKFKRLTNKELEQYTATVNSTAKKYNVASNFLIPHKDKLIPLSSEDIAFCYTSNEKVTIYTIDGDRLSYDKSLDTIVNLLPSSQFFRANRQFIISKSSIKDLSVWFGSRLSLNLNLTVPERIIISRARTPEFKRWYIGVEE